MAKMAARSSLALVMLLMAAGCAGPNPSTAARDETQTSAPAAQKTLVMAIQQEPTDFYGFSGSVGFGGVGNVPPIAHDTLVVQDHRGELQPQLAAEPLSLERGTWRVNPDGTMVTTWRLKPNVKWQDGTPFTAEDLVFTVRVRLDPELGIRNNSRMDLVESVSAPAPLSFVVHWSAPYVDANQAIDLDPLAGHLLQETYLHQKEGFLNSPFLSSQFVGLGPYRLVEWQRGSQMIFARFEDYHQGRPPLDRVVVRFIGDANAMVASILSGAVDIVLPRGVGLEAAVEVQQRWAGTGHQVRFDLSESPRQIEIQFRPEVARPRDGLTSLPVRQAFYQAIDRKLLADLFALGMAPPADSWLVPGSALREALEHLVPQYPYDPTRAQQRLAGAGWARGADGVLVHASTGERFETELRVTLPDEQKMMSVVANQWKVLGAQVTETVVPPARASDREYGSTYAGGLFSAGPMQAMVFAGRTHSKDIRSPANRWNGRNRSGYSHPQLDALLDRVAVAIDPAERTTLLGEILRHQFGELIVMPLIWDAVPVLQLKGVKSHPTVSRATTWNFFAFDKE